MSKEAALAADLITNLNVMFFGEVVLAANFFTEFLNSVLPSMWGVQPPRRPARKP